MTIFPKKIYSIPLQVFIFNMPITKLEIKKENRDAHIEIAKEIALHRGGLLHFEVRFSGGNIVDSVVRDFYSYKKLIDGTTFVHMVLEKLSGEMKYGQASFTVMIDDNGEPLVDTLKVTTSKRKKYGNKKTLDI